MKNIGLKGLLLCFALYVGMVGVLWVEQRGAMYHPDTTDHTPEDVALGGMQEIELLTKDGQRNESWFLFPSEPGKKIVIFFHGNSGNVSTRSAKVRHFIDAGLGVVLVGYRGYGGNMGRPTEDGLYEDARAVLRDLITRGYAPEQWVLYGESLGTGVAVKMATEHKNAAGLILEVPFDSALAVARERYWYVVGLSSLMMDQYPSDARVGKIEIPKLFLIAGKDTVIPPNHARRLFDLARSPKQKVEFADAGHNNVYDFHAATPVIDFINTLPSE